MSADLQVFQFAATGHQVRTVLVDERPWFVAADVCSVLDVRTRDVMSALDDDEKMRDTVADTVVDLISEPGLYSAALRSRKPEALAFKRWITHEVLPAIRKAGTYTVPGAPEFEIPQTYPEALRLAANFADQAEAERAARLAAERRAQALEPSAAAWDHLGKDDGDWSVGDAAKILSRDPLIEIGRDQLFALLAELRWTYRDRGDGKWRPYQSAIASGRLLVLPQSHIHPRTGDVVLDAPRVRVTPRGLAELRRTLAGGEQLALTAA